ncbi:MAG: hypothetical protein M3Y41_17210 [Pseudomonadota bacterium]|nr:hypothetical protein [Pseudomonadota bacterium]
MKPNRLRLACALLLAWVIAAAPFAPLRAQPAPGASSWPHSLTVNGVEVVVYQPQAISWPEHKTLTARAAVAITPPGAKAPLLGTIDVSLATTTDMTTRSVILSDPKLEGSHFPSLSTGEAAQLEEKIRAALPDMQTKAVPLEAVLLSLKETPTAKSVDVNNDPPTIYYSSRPASLVVFDGEPVLVPIGKTGLSYAVNTN